MTDDPTSLTLKGKCALITGAATGIGRAIAITYASAGANVIINYAPDQPSPDDLLEQINQAAGGRAVAVPADISDLTTHAKLLDVAITRFGRLDILVNNAGIKGKLPVFEVDPALWDAVMGVNLRGPFFLAQSAARIMAANQTKGRIINVTSIHESKALRGSSVYSISKSGLGMLTKSLALELAKHGITVNSLIPGAYASAMTQHVLDDPARLALGISKIPLGKFGAPDDIVGAALFLASAQSAYMTGASIKVDGGLSL
jgi:glucose 1-dehydrogenase